MAHTLKTSGLATDLVFCLAVDQDGTTVKEFVSSSVNTDMTVDGSVTTGSSSWKGTSRGYFETSSNGTFNFHGIRFGTTKPDMVGNDADGLAIFCAVASIAAATGTPWFIGTTEQLRPAVPRC